MHNKVKVKMMGNEHVMSHFKYDPRVTGTEHTTMNNYFIKLFAIRWFSQTQVPVVPQRPNELGDELLNKKSTVSWRK